MDTEIEFEWLDVAMAETVAPGDYAIAEHDDRLIAVVNANGEFFAIEDLCTHDGEELTGGPVDGCEIICPRHGARFCLRTGKALSAPAYEPVETFPVRKTEKGMLQVGIRSV